MERLFDSMGNHIANVSGERLYATSGKNIGRSISNGFFVDIGGKYLGEVVAGNRLLYRSNSPYKNTNYGNAGNAGNIGNAGNPGNHGSLGTTSGFVDVDKNKLR